ncbi:sigma-70 family RNA polymerase sigma factor [bacterium]|nr:sigma-70 family RNA polymerase sigma factor [bacterium]
MDDSGLMFKTATGDTEAFRELVERYQKSMFNFFLRATANPEDAEDLTQTLFLNLFKSSNKYRKTSSFKTYIYRIASNLAISFARKKKGKTIVPIDNDGQLNNSSFKLSLLKNPSLSLEAGELENKLKTALSKLPPDLSTAIELRVKQGFSYSEIAEVMHKSISAVESMIFRARKILVVELEDFLDYRND